MSGGDLAQGFAVGHVIAAREFHTATVHQGYIEPQNATALWSQDGTLDIWCSTQAPSPHKNRSQSYWISDFVGAGDACRDRRRFRRQDRRLSGTVGRAVIA